MSTPKHRTALPALITLLLLVAARWSYAVPQTSPQNEGSADVTLAPQLQVIGARPGEEAVPLKSTNVQATISGVIADVTVEQVYSNTGKLPIEALYVFPASTRAAVHGVEMHIGSRIIKSKVQEKKEAKATYEKAKSENKTASLLEQQRPNVFQMSVANILPGDEIRVTLHYSEKLTATDRVYEFMFPTVVGPRYSAKGAQTEAWVQNPYLAEGVKSPSTFALTVNVNAGMPLQSLTSPSHTSARIAFQGKDNAQVTLSPADDTANRDFILRYQLAEQQVASGLLLHKGESENFFLLNVQPPARVTPDQIPPRDYIFIMDVSGSMNGFPIMTAQTLMKNLLEGLRPIDTFNVMLFASTSELMSETPLHATRENIAKAIQLSGFPNGGGGTNLLPAMQRALAMPSPDGTSRSMIVITDGLVDIEREAFQLVRENLNKANLFAFGIGSSVNRHLIEGLSAAGHGEPFIVLDAGEAAAKAERLRQYISSPVLTDIEVRYEGFAVQDPQPAVIPDVFADRPIELIGKWTGKPEGRIIVKGKTGGAPYEASFDVAAESAKGLSNPALRPLWAKDKIRGLSEGRLVAENTRGTPTRSETAKLTQESEEITHLGLNYELLTEYTSFVGVDETPRELLAQAQTVNQPLPLPKGLTNQAVGGGGVPAPAPVVVSQNSPIHTGTTPEPGVTALLIMTAASLLLHRRRKW